MKENQPLAPFTTFAIGGPARWFVEAGSEDEVAEAAAWAREREIALFVLGGGSNLLVSDAGFNGLVLRVGLRGISASRAAERPGSDSKSCQGTTSVVPQMEQNIRGALAPVECSSENLSSSIVPDHTGQMIYAAAAGEDWNDFVERTVQDNCAGVECLAGIPGTVGGTPVQNVGAYGQEVCSVIERVRAFDLKEHTYVEFSAPECGFAYRRSRFNTEDRGRYIVTRVDYRLSPGGAPTLRYADVQRAIQQNRLDGVDPSLAEVARIVRQVRQSKGMLLVERDPNCRSAGSFFKNPVVTETQLQRMAESSGREPPRFSAGAGAENAGQVKVPAAWLIEQSGFVKGTIAGAAGISSRHTLALINRGGASAAEILALAAQIANAVEVRFGIRLQMEPVLVGF